MSDSATTGFGATAVEPTSVGDGPCRIDDPELRDATIMLVDDEPVNCKVTRAFLKREGYRSFITVTESTEAVALIQRDEPDLIILDVMMPEIDGLQILERVRADEATARIPVLILTATEDRGIRRRALDLGATDFLSKPVDADELLPRVGNALLLKSHHDRLERYAEELEERVRQRTATLHRSQVEVVHCLARASEYRDDELGRHVIRVGRYVGIIATAMGLDRETVELFELAAPLHDVGKLAMPDSILLKPSKLSPDEYALVKGHATTGKEILAPLSHTEEALWCNHPKIGASILGDADLPLLKVAARIALSHHEKWDGTGYPLGRAGDDIPLEGRITAVADVYDALSRKRPYKPPYPREKCFRIMREERGKHFDPRVLDAFLDCSEQIIEAQLAYPDV